MTIYFQRQRAGCSHFGVPVSSGLLAGCKIEPVLFAVRGGRPACHGFAATSGLPFIGISGPTNWGYGCTPRGIDYGYRSPVVDPMGCHYAVICTSSNIRKDVEDPLRKYTPQGDLVTSTAIDDLDDDPEMVYESVWSHATGHLYLGTNTALRKYDSDLNRVWTLWWTVDNEYGGFNRMAIDLAGQIYLINGRESGDPWAYRRLIKIDKDSRAVLWDTLFNTDGYTGVSYDLACSVDGFVYACRRAYDEGEKSIYRYTQAAGSASGSVRALTNGHRVQALCCTPGGYVIAGIQEYDPEDEYGGFPRIKKFSSALGAVWTYSPETDGVGVGGVACDNYDHVYAVVQGFWDAVTTDALFGLTAAGDLRWASPTWRGQEVHYIGLHYWPMTWLY